ERQRDAAPQHLHVRPGRHRLAVPGHQGDRSHHSIPAWSALMRSVLNSIRQYAAALRMLLIFTVILGVAYPLFITLVGQIPGLKSRADGSLIKLSGQVVGSKLIGQSFTDEDG